MKSENRRRFLAGAGLGFGLGCTMARAHGSPGARLELAETTFRAVVQDPGQRPPRPPAGISVLNPRDRVPVSLIIDDSTCLVNLAHFCIPQFHEVFPDQYRQPWKTLPREIPDAFVRKFAAWCHDRGIRGKYSLIPYPACVGWLDRDLPGWSKRDLDASLDIVRTTMMPDWDIHPEIVSHTWVVDTKTGRPYRERTADYMENWGWSVGKSADELGHYLSYALQILETVGVTCTGITTPGGFGIRALPELAKATLQSCRDVFRTAIPHYYRHTFTDARSVVPRVEYASGLDGPDPRCVVSIIACTGDWFGGWDGLSFGSVDRFITADLKGGRLPEVIARGEPAIMACHWPGMYFNGQEVGFTIFQEVVRRLHTAYDNLIWMKLSDIARYWAARELTHLERTGRGQLDLRAPFACPSFTVRINRREFLDGGPDKKSPPANVRLWSDEKNVALTPVAKPRQLATGTFISRAQNLVACFDLPWGVSRLLLE
jgi:hypothetical protein